jgi:hypothetical protein
VALTSGLYGKNLDSITYKREMSGASLDLRRSTPTNNRAKIITVLLVSFWGTNHSIRTGGGALWSGADGPRHRPRRSATWREARVPYLTAGQSAP